MFTIGYLIFMLYEKSHGRRGSYRDYMNYIFHRDKYNQDNPNFNLSDNPDIYEWSQASDTINDGLASADMGQVGEGVDQIIHSFDDTGDQISEISDNLGSSDSNVGQYISELLELLKNGSEGSSLSTDQLIKLLEDQRAYGEEQINDARKWQEMMASTAYQRTFADIEKAGYNPWLALQSGGVQPASFGSVDSGSALGSANVSFSNSNSNSNSAILVAIIAMIARLLA